MRKLIVLLLIVAMALSLAACGEGSGDATTTTPTAEAAKVRTIKYYLTADDTFDTWFDTEYWHLPFAREDDGLLSRDGYVLLGYTLDKEGKGELIRPGYKYELPNGEEQQALYCVWAKETNPADFTVSANEDGVTITAYNGSEAAVYIPREIDGKEVVAIGKGAFSGNQTLKEVHITPTVLSVAGGAFAACPNLKTVTVYDNLSSIGDASFTGSPVETVRMCAAQLPRYIKSLETFGKKYERLLETAGQKRIIVVAGSSAQYGIDSDYMQTLFKNEYAVVNFGTNGNMNVALFLDAITPFLTKDDVVVFAPEQYGPYAYTVNGNPEMAAATFQGLSTCYNLFEKINVANYTNVFNAIGSYCAVAANMSPLSWEEQNKYLDDFGDLKTLTNKMNATDFCKGANGQFRFNETVIPEEFIAPLNRVIDSAKQTGATVVFSYPSHNKNNVEADSMNETAWDAYDAWIAETVHCQLISHVRNYLYNGEYFYNTDYHLNSVGRELHTKQVAADLILAKIGVK